MKRFVKKMALVVTAGLLLFSATACSGLVSALDVIGNGSVVSFEAVLEALPNGTTWDENHAGWALTAPDNGARLIWREDWSSSTAYDIMLEFDASPFVEAGLDVDRLPDHFILNGQNIILGTTAGSSQPTDAEGIKGPLAAFEQIVNHRRDLIGYHMDLDHFGVDLGNGMFEWAKDMSTNDKDIVFVLDPEALLQAGVNPEAVEGWALSKVKVHADGKSIEVDKFLKPFDLM